MVYSRENLDIPSNMKIYMPRLTTKNPSDSGSKLEWHLMDFFHQGKKIKPWANN